MGRTVYTRDELEAMSINELIRIRFHYLKAITSKGARYTKNTTDIILEDRALEFTDDEFSHYISSLPNNVTLAMLRVYNKILRHTIGKDHPYRYRFVRLYIMDQLNSRDEIANWVDNKENCYIGDANWIENQLGLWIRGASENTVREVGEKLIAKKTKLASVILAEKKCPNDLIIPALKYGSCTGPINVRIDLPMIIDLPPSKKLTILEKVRSSVPTDIWNFTYEDVKKLLFPIISTGTQKEVDKARDLIKHIRPSGKNVHSYKTRLYHYPTRMAKRSRSHKRKR